MSSSLSDKENQTMIDEYIDYFNKYTQKYGRRTAVFIEVGAFYEGYGVENEYENVGNIQEIAKLLNIQLTKKNKSKNYVSRGNPLTAGVPSYAFQRHLNVLLENQYTIVLIEQFDVKGSKKKLVKLPRLSVREHMLMKKKQKTIIILCLFIWNIILI